MMITRYLAHMADRVALGLWMICMTVGLSGCSFDTQSTKTPIERLDFSSSFTAAAGGVQQGLSPEDYDPQALKNPAKVGLSEDASKAYGCDIGDRFDRGATLAYNFDNQQSRLALHLSVSGPSLSDPGQLDFNSVFVRYTHKFSKPPESVKAKCRFQSNFQGLIGSTYNELFLRTNYPVWKELRQKLNFSH